MASVNFGLNNVSHVSEKIRLIASSVQQMLCCNIYLYPKERPWHRTVFFKLENFNVLLQHDSMPRKRRNWISLWIKVKNKYLMKRQYPALLILSRLANVAFS